MIKNIEGVSMTINNFAVKVSKKEGKAKQVNIAQIKEILKVTNKILGGDLYPMIRSIKIWRIAL